MFKSLDSGWPDSLRITRNFGLSHWGGTVDWRCVSWRCWGEYLDLRGRKQQEAGKNFIICTLHQVFWRSRQEGWDERGIHHAWETREMSKKFWLGNLKGSILGRPGRRWENNNRRDLTEIGWEGVDWIYLTQDWNQWRTGGHGYETSGLKKKEENLTS